MSKSIGGFESEFNSRYVIVGLLAPTFGPHTFFAYFLNVAIFGTPLPVVDPILSAREGTLGIVPCPPRPVI